MSLSRIGASRGCNFNIQGCRAKSAAQDALDWRPCRLLIQKARVIVRMSLCTVRLARRDRARN